MGSALEQAFALYGVVLHPGVREQTVCCPVHGETRPSCRVNVLKGVFFCHGCGARGNYLSLIMLMEGLENIGDARAFAADAGIRAEADGEGGKRVSRGGKRSRYAGRVSGTPGTLAGERRYVPPRRGG